MSDKLTPLIYALIDPRTLLIRYIGLTKRGLERVRDHRKVRREVTHRSRWIDELRNLGLEYQFAVLQVVEDVDRLPAAEQWWIAYGKACGWPLTNATDGGEGTLNPSPETKAKMRDRLRELMSNPEMNQRRSERSRAARGTPESRAKSRAATLAQSDESKAKRSAALKGRKRPPEVVAKIVAARMRTPEIRALIGAKISAAKMGHSVSPETREKMRLAKVANPGPRDVITGRYLTKANWTTAQPDTDGPETPIVGVISDLS